MPLKSAPAGNVKNSPASDAPETSRSNRSEDDRAGEMNAAAAGVIEPVTKGIHRHATQHGCRHTRPVQRVGGGVQPERHARGRHRVATRSRRFAERWYCANASHRQMLSPTPKSPRSPTVLPSVARSNAKLRRPSSSTRRAMPPEMRALPVPIGSKICRVVDEQRAHIRSQHRVGGVVAHFEVRVRSGQDRE